MYHEVLPDKNKIASWTIVKESEFTKQMKFLQQNFTIVSLCEFMENGYDHKNNRPYAVITFDDGYLGNYSTVLPIIEKLKIPITIYISTEAIVANNRYWYDKVIEIFTQKNVNKIDLKQFNLKLYKFSNLLGEERRWSQIQQLLTDLKEIHPQQRADIVSFLCKQFEVSKKMNMLTSEQVKRLSQSNFVTIGAHSHCHNLLTQLNATELQDSLALNKELLENWTDSKVDHFAYPNGTFNQKVVDAVGCAKFKTAVTTVGASASLSDNPLLLPRLGIGRFDSINYFSYHIGQTS